MAISGRILISGDEPAEIALSDENLVANSLSISMSTCRKRSYDFGTFNAAILKIGIIDDNAAQHDFSGALVQLEENIVDEEGDAVTVGLGEYRVDGSSIKRQRSSVTMQAQDASASFDADIADSARTATYTALTLFQAACTAVDESLSPGVDLAAFPNTAVTFDLKNESIQTWRDAVMWACQLIAANAVIDRAGTLDIRPAWYVYNANPDFTSDGSDRADIEFSDTRVYVKYMTAYSGNKVKTYISPDTSEHAGARAGMLNLSKNPLLSNKTEAECDTINTAILAKDYMQREIKAKMFSNSEIKLGDLGMFSGGKVDVRNSIRGKVTGIEWKYHGFTTVTCTAPEPVTNEEAANAG